MSSRGVRSIIERTFNCPYFKKNNDVLEKAYDKHSSMVETIKRVLEKKGMDCHQEFSITHGNVRGKIDLLCSRGDDEEYIIEVKSSKFSRSRVMKDFLQLASYTYVLVQQDKGNKRFIPVLVYSYGSKLLFLKVKKESKLWSILIKFGEMVVENLKSADSHTSRRMYVISELCYYCLNDNCPFKQSSEEDHAGSK